MGPRGALLGLLRRCARGACVNILACAPGLSGGPKADSLRATARVPPPARAARYRLASCWPWLVRPGLLLSQPICRARPDIENSRKVGRQRAPGPRHQCLWRIDLHPSLDLEVWSGDICTNIITCLDSLVSRDRFGAMLKKLGFLMGRVIVQVFSCCWDLSTGPGCSSHRAQLPTI